MGSALEELTREFPPACPVQATAVRQACAAALPDTVLVVLDDDPTGTQSVADLPVLTAWEEEDFRWAFAERKPAVYVMTNSRSLIPELAAQVNREVVGSANAVAMEAGVKLVFVSRSDSTLRGHFPLETDVIADVSVQAVDGIIVVPAFGEAGRVTVQGIHYARIGTRYLPVGQTEFARDATFGYEASSLPQWVEEKTAGAVPAIEVESIDLAMLRTDPDAVLELLMGAHRRQVVVVDAVTEEDLRTLALALIKAEAAGKNFVYRVGPPFVRARIGQDPHAPLRSNEIGEPPANATPGGLVVIGSHVDLTTRQLLDLNANVPSTDLEIVVANLGDTELREHHLEELIDQAVAGLERGLVIVRTSRRLVKGTDGDSSLSISRNVSAAVVSVVQGILARVTPRFVLAKGGITSSDVASKGLGIRHANVVGPMLPGIVSLWTAQDGPAQGIPYIVFAGNVGDETSLTKVVGSLQGRA